MEAPQARQIPKTANRDTGIQEYCRRRDHATEVRTDEDNDRARNGCRLRLETTRLPTRSRKREVAWISSFVKARQPPNAQWG
jgi:hypothetical protein